MWQNCAVVENNRELSTLQEEHFFNTGSMRNGCTFVGTVKMKLIGSEHNTKAVAHCDSPITSKMYSKVCCKIQVIPAMLSSGTPNGLLQFAVVLG